MRLAVAGHDRDRLGRDALEACELVRVDAHLEDRGGLDALGELRVGDVVAPRAEVRRPVVAPEQEVRVAAPAAVEERGLEDDVRPGAHRGERLGLGGIAAPPGVLGLAARHLDDRAALLAERLDVQRLVLVAAPPDELELRVVADGLLELAARTQLLERHQVVALEEADEVCRGHDQRAVVMELHRAVHCSPGSCQLACHGSAASILARASARRRAAPTPPLDCRRAAAAEASEPHRRARRRARSRRRGRASSTGRSARRWRTAGSTTCRTRASRCRSRTRRTPASGRSRSGCCATPGSRRRGSRPTRRSATLLAQRDALLARAAGASSAFGARA